MVTERVSGDVSTYNRGRGRMRAERRGDGLFHILAGYGWKRREVEDENSRDNGDGVDSRMGGMCELLAGKPGERDLQGLCKHDARGVRNKC